jgi:glycosyltransferase involved in cell wall biosynthesis
VVGNVARLVPQKGHRVLVEAAPKIVARHPDVHFVVVGEGELREELEAAAPPGRFLFTGQREDVPELLASFDAFALPSFFEGLCYAVIEAQAAGVPVVATPVGGVRENVVDGETGVVVPPGDANALAAAINRLLDDPQEAKRLADEARRRVLERYSVTRMVEETLAIYGATSS